MPSPSYTTLSAEKRASNYAKIPSAWRLPPHLLPDLTSLTAIHDPAVPQTSNVSSPNISVLDIPRKSGVLSPYELDLTEKYSAEELVKGMASGEVRCVDVVTAFCKRAAIAHQCVNCLTEIMFEEAIEKARDFDKNWVESGEGKGALYGLPVSLKDSFNVTGHTTTIGYVSFLANPPATHDSTLVALVRDQGAIFYCKTNLPQTMMTADSHNNVFGRTLNPHSLSLTAGGSTGGEGALLAMRGSPLGVTTDIAGSCRIPALCNGVKAFKPSASRVPFGGGVPPGRLGSPSSILPVIGPVGHSVGDLELFMKTVMDAEPWNYDEGVLGVPWRRVQPFTRPLRFGVVGGHEKRPLLPPVVRAIATAASELEKAGHEGVDIQQSMIPDLWDGAVLAFKFFLLDPKKTAVKFVEDGGEPWVPSIKTAVFPELVGWEPSLDELFDMNVQRAKICKVWHDLVVKEKLDFILMPGYQGTAVPHDTYGLPIYTVLANLLNYPAGILPYLKADKEVDEKLVNPSQIYEPPYEPENVEGAPAAIQLMGKPMKDEELIEVMKVVEGIMEKRDNGRVGKTVDGPEPSVLPN